MKLPRHRLFGLLLFLPGLFQLPRQHTLNGDCLDLFPNPFLFEEAIKVDPLWLVLSRFLLAFLGIPLVSRILLALRLPNANLAFCGHNKTASPFVYAFFLE